MGLKAVIFLGRARPSVQNTRMRAFQFDGYTAAPLRLAGVAMFRWLCATKEIPQEVVIYGNTTADWDMLHELAARPYTDPELQRLGLRGAINRGGISQAQADQLGEVLSTILVSVRVRCHLLHPVTSHDARLRTIKLIASHFDRRDELHVDVSDDVLAAGLITGATLSFFSSATHGGVRAVYVSLPQHTGAFGTPVMIVDDLNDLGQWSNALMTFHRDGVTGPIVRQFAHVNPAIADAFSAINFAVVTNQYTDMHRAFGRARQEIKAHIERSEDQLSTMFAEFMIRELRWLKAEHMADWELEFARRALLSQDVVRCARLAQNAVVSAAIAHPASRTNDAYRAQVLSYLLDPKLPRAVFSVDSWPYVQLDVILRALAGDPAARASDDAREWFSSMPRLLRALERAVSFAAILVTRFRRVPPY